MTIEERVKQLEWGALWWRRIALVSIAVLAVVVLVGQRQAGQKLDLTVRSLTIVDDSGATKAEFRVGGPNRVARLILYDEKDKLRQGRSRVPSAYLSPTKLTFTSPASSDTFQVAEIGCLGSDGETGLNLKVDTMPRASVGLRADGNPFITLFGGRGERRADLRLRGGMLHPIGSLTMHDYEGEVIWKAPP